MRNAFLMKNSIYKEEHDWTRNVVDEFKSLSNEDINNKLRSTAVGAAVLMSQIEADFNFGTVIRNANGFNLKTVYYFGKKRWDRRSSLGCHHYVELKYLSTIEEVASLKQEYKFVVAENTKDAVSLPNYSWSKNSLIVIGEEGGGVCKEVLDLADDVVKIPMTGSVRSFNAGSAACVVMYDYIAKTCF